MKAIVFILIALNVLLFGGLMYMEHQQEITTYLEELTKPSYTPLGPEVDPAVGPGLAPPEEETISETETVDETADAPMPSDTAMETAQSPTHTNPAIADKTPPIEPKKAPNDTVPTPRQKPQKPVEKRLSCIEMGPIGTQQVARLKKIIGPLPTDTTVKEIREKGQSNLYWVYLPLTGQAGDRQKQMDLLKEKGVKEYFYIENGQTGSALSLGVFRYHTRAQSLQQELIKKGIEAQIGQRNPETLMIQFHQAPASIKRHYRALQEDFPSLTIIDCKA